MNLEWNCLLNTYEDSIDIQIGVIERYRTVRKKAIRCGNFKEVQRVNGILRILCAAHLRQYLLA